jgi:hypothetical protein
MLVVLVVLVVQVVGSKQANQQKLDPQYYT